MSLAALAASEIVKLAFSEFVKAGAGELAKKSVGEAIYLSNRLRERIRIHFRGKAHVEAALIDIEDGRNPAALNEVIKYLDIEMQKDQAFATEIRQIAQGLLE